MAVICINYGGELHKGMPWSGYHPVLTRSGSLVFMEAGLQLVQVSPQIILLEFITEGAHGGQLLQQTPVLVTHNLSIAAIRDQEPVQGNSNQVPPSNSIVAPNHRSGN